MDREKLGDIVFAVIFTISWLCAIALPTSITAAIVWTMIKDMTTGCLLK